MGKSKQMKEFTLEDGRCAVFNQVAFEYTVNQKARAVDRRNGKTRGGKAEVLRTIAARLRPYNAASAFPVVKNWYYGNNGPDSIEDIRLLAIILECDDENTFLKEKKEEHKLNTTSEMVNVNIDQGRIIAALKYIKEKEVAYELYSMMVDMMGAYMKTDLDIWLEYEEGTTEWREAIKHLPDRYPIYQAITKASLYLPKDTVMKAYNLLEEMYGPRWLDWEETNRAESLDFFIDQRHRMYVQYCEEHGLSKDPDTYLRDDNWNNFAMELNEEWPWKLDRVFEDYFPG